MFGRESAGVPDEVAAAADARLVIPIKPGLRSLNVAMAAAMALGEALRQTGRRLTGPAELGNCKWTCPVIEDRKARARAWFEALRDDICAAFERLEDDAPAALYPGERRAFRAHALGPHRPYRRSPAAAA